MTTMKKILMILLTSWVSTAVAVQTPATSITSPENQLRVEFLLTEKGQPAYKTFYKGKELVAESRMGFSLHNQAALEQGFKLISSKVTKVDQTWEQPWGEERFIRNHYNQLRIALRESAGEKRKLDIVFRVYDDGVGFRYEFPEQNALSNFEITRELTEFNMADDHPA
jgi:alpha-glucosidase